MSWLTGFFLHPGLVWFLPLVAVPIILHLLMLHRLKTVELSTFHFLFDSYVQQRRRMRFLEALLAMLRALFLLFLVLVFCRPVVSHFGGLFHSGSGHDIVLLIDGSASMNAKTDGVAAIDRAKIVAQAVAGRLAPQDRLRIIRAGSRPDEVFSQFASDPEAIRAKIDGLKTGPGRANMFAALTYLFGPEAERRPNLLLYVLTDCQAGGWREVRGQGLERLIPAEAQVVVVNVGSKEALHNLAVVGDAPRRQRALVGLPVFLQPRVVNYSKTEAADATVKVLIDEKEVTRQQVTLKPGETAAPKVVYYPSEPGVHRGQFEVTGKTADRFPDDDSYLFTLQVAPRLKVVLVNGNPAPDQSQDEGLYLRSVLTASREPTREEKKTEEKILRAAGLGKDFFRALDVQEIPERDLSAARLTDAAVVILANCGGLNAQQFGWLRDFVYAGGGLLIFPGDRVNADVYNNQFFTVANSQQPALTPVRLGPPEGDPDRADSFEHLAAVDFSHPVLSIFDAPDRHYFQTVHFSKWFPLLLPEKKADNLWPLALFARKGTPALIESRFGDGIVLLAAFPANTRWTNLPARGGNEFVPLVLRAVSYVQHRPDVEAPRVIAADGVAEIAVAGTWHPVEGKVTHPDGRVTPLTFERAGSRLRAAFEGTAAKGYYAVDVHSARSEQARGATAAFAVNLAPEESDFTTLGEEQLRELLPSVQLSVVDASAEAQQDFGAIGTQKEIWRWLIWILFPLILVEFLLATLGGQRKDTEEAPTVAERIRALNPGSWVARMTR
jgi:hypothetical protein